jgi:Inner membrane protein YgaP-like, transmembrane domain
MAAGNMPQNCPAGQQTPDPGQLSSMNGVVLGTRHAKIIAVSRFFQPNISHHGRMARGVIGALCLIAGMIVVDYQLWLGLVFVAAGLFAIFESIRGWCLVRACGLKTKI